MMKFFFFTYTVYVNFTEKKKLDKEIQDNKVS